MPKEPIDYNLIGRPCIPAIETNGCARVLNLQDTLLKAQELREVYHSSPIVSASLIRLLVAVLTDIYALPNSSSWGKVWSREKFDPELITAYFERYHDRFDLFHEKFPFYQCAALEDDAPVNLNLLASELATGNNATLFDHSLDTEEHDYSPVEAFHLLLASQNFALAGLLRRTTRLRGVVEPLYWQSAYGGILIPGAMIWLAGDNLFETLTLNLAPLANQSDEDCPAWRVDQPELLRDELRDKKKISMAPRGTRDRLTFQSRLIRLLPTYSEQGEVVVRRAAFNHGRSIDPLLANNFDPMQAYRASKKEGYLVTRLSPERAAWRDTHSLIGLSQPTPGKFTRRTPVALETVAHAMDRGVEGLSSERMLRLNVAGLANDQAKILVWRHDRMDTPAQVLCDPAIAQMVGFLLQEAEEIAGDLRVATRRVCEIFLAPLTRDPAGKPVEGAMRADPDRVTALADSIDPRPAYWARLESSFQQLLLHLVQDADLAANQWQDRVQREALCAFEETKEKLGDSPQTMKAAALVKSAFLVPSRRVKGGRP